MSYSPLTTHHSPNFNPRPDGTEISLLVLHYTGMKGGEEALDKMCDKASQVSAHYMVEEDGRVFQLVEEKNRAWHAGVSYWQGNENINDISIGIEIVNPGHEFGYRKFPDIQMQSVLKLSNDIVKRHNIKPQNVVAHSDIAPERKEDPGELFNWKLLAENGIGLFVELNGESLEFSEWDIAEMQKNLQKFGYNIDIIGEMDKQTKLVITAFQRHYVQDRLNKDWSKKEAYILRELLRKIENNV